MVFNFYIGSFSFILALTIHVFPHRYYREKKDKMAQTNPMPMGPWKVSIWRTCLTLYHPSAQGTATTFNAWLGTVVFLLLCIFSPTVIHGFFCALQITVYDQEYFQGRRMEFTACCQNIMECGMENIRSLKVECGAYVSRELFLTFGPTTADLKTKMEKLFFGLWEV